MSEGVEIICVGLSRTGTSSLKAALSILLPGITYHGMDFLNEINDQQSSVFWEAMRSGRASTSMIREYFISRHCSAVCDVPSIWYWQQIQVRDVEFGKYFTSLDVGRLP